MCRYGWGFCDKFCGRFAEAMEVSLWFVRPSVTVAIAKGAANCRLGDIHTLEKSVDIRRVEAWLWVRDG